jgi:hypothetical protein
MRIRGAVDGSTFARVILIGITLLLLGYLALLALNPQIRFEVPRPLQWFGNPNSWQTIAVVAAFLVVLGALALRARHRHGTGAPVAVIAFLAMTSVVLGGTSYWRCYDETHPRFFTTVIWTVELVKGSVGAQSLDGGTCPSPPPVALEIGRLTALAAVFLSVIGVAIALFRSSIDRLIVRLARSVTAVVDIDDDAASMVGAIAATRARGSTLALITATPDRQCVQDARNQGARIVPVDFRSPQTLADLSLWRKLDKLYLLSPDPSANLMRLQSITERVSKVGPGHRLPLIVRIDDPWQAAAWRAQHFGGTQTAWAADAVGKYEVTAHRLLDRITAAPAIERLLVAGASQLTLALCADMAQRQLERDYYAAPGQPELPRMTLIAENAGEFKRDHEFSREQLGLPPDRPDVEAIEEKPSASALMSLIGKANPASTAVIVVDAMGTWSDAGIGTRLAARFPDTLIYAWDPNAEVTDDRPAVVGRLCTYRLSMDIPEGQAHDNWERAARLIHDRYAAQVEKRTAATRPWTELDEFYRGSNRRAVQNALWMVEKIGGHTWNTFGTPVDSAAVTGLHGLPPLDQLRLMGFDRATALAMARAEHEDWCRYYRAGGWAYGPTRDDAAKIHDKLVDWETIEADPKLLDSAVRSLAATLSKLRELGYRSRPQEQAAEWRPFRRIGTVIAEQRGEPWTWTTRSGHAMQAEAGDWAVREPAGDRSWSVKDHIFRARYRHIDGQQWQRLGMVQARRARHGETIETLEGPVTATADDWVVKGEHGDTWPVPADEFHRRYENQPPS